MTGIEPAFGVDLMRELVPDGSTIAFGGAGLNRKPMSLVRLLVESGTRDLTVVAYLGSLEVELLVAAGSASVVHTAGTGLEGLGLAPRFRAARESGAPKVIEWSEGSLAAALEAGALGLGSMPCGTSPRSEVVVVNDWLRVAPDPFTGDGTVHAKALVPDLAIIQGSAVDEAGNIHIDGDPGIDALVAKAARRTVAVVPAVEDRPPRAAALPRIWIDRVMVDPGGAWPTACHPRSRVDLAAVSAWARSGGEDASLLLDGAP